MEELDIMELLYALKKKIKYIIVAVIICAVAGYLYSEFLITPMYKATTSFVLSKVTYGNEVQGEEEIGNLDGSGITQNDINLNSKLVPTYSSIIKSRAVAESVIQSLNLNMSINEFSRNISVSSKDDTEMIEIVVSNEDPEVGKKIAYLLLDIFREKVSAIYNINNMTIVDEPWTDNVPYNVGTVKNILLFALVGLFVSCGVIFVIVYFDDTVKDEKDVEALTGIPVIASIPRVEDEDKGGEVYGKKRNNS